MSARVGVMGGGQLARMLAVAGVPMGLCLSTFDPAADACAAQLVPQHRARFDDTEALRRFAAEVDVVTFDFENVPAASAEALAASVPVYPSPRALAVAQDRLAEKTLFGELGIPVAGFANIDSLDGLRDAVARLGLPCILKTRRLGYDGKGQFRLRHADDIDAAWAALGPQVGSVGLILEAFVAFQREVSVVAVRGRDGEFRSWPLTENWHDAGILSASLAPAAVGADLAEQAVDHARRLAQSLDYVGVFALEMFVRDGQLLANEMAPRVHNAGHWTIEGAETSQFENHLRAVLGLPLGSTRPRGYSAMLNWIGEIPDPAVILHEPGGHWHDYGKSSRPGRKVGHATLRHDDPQALADSLLNVGAALGRPDLVRGPVARLGASARGVPA